MNLRDSARPVAAILFSAALVAALTACGSSSSPDAAGVPLSQTALQCAVDKDAVHASTGEEAMVSVTVMVDGMPFASEAVDFHSTLGVMDPPVAVSGVDGVARSAFRPLSQPGEAFVTASVDKGASRVETTCVVDVLP